MRTRRSGRSSTTTRSRFGGSRTTGRSGRRKRWARPRRQRPDTETRDDQMASITQPVATEAAIFAEIWDRSPSRLTVPVARYLLTLQFSDDERQHVVELVRRNLEGGLSATEVVEMDNYLKVGDLLALLQSKA